MNFVTPILTRMKPYETLAVLVQVVLDRLDPELTLLTLPEKV
jgi:hypothetical protein